MSRSLKTLVVGSLAVAAALAGGLAQAGSNVYWSVDFAVPGVPVAVGGTVSNVPRVTGYPMPTVVMPRVAVPPPVVVHPYPVVYEPRPFVVVPQPVVYGPPAYYVDHRGWRGNRWHPRHGRHGPYRD